MTLVSSRRRSCHAFTLIEILIVLAIIGILAAILLPVFSRVRNSAYTTTCASNLRQIGAALEMYANDYNGYYPTMAAVTPCTWADLIAPRLKSNDVFKCPANPRGEYRSDCTAFEKVDGTVYNYNGSYTLNLVVPYGTMRQTRWKHPTTTIFFIDGDGGFNGFNSNIGPTIPLPGDGGNSTSGVRLPHNDGANVLFGDSHVKWQPRSFVSQSKYWLVDEVP